MDIFVRALPDQSTEKQLRDFFRPHLESVRVHAFNIHKLKNKGCAILTIPNEPAAKKFLKSHGSSKDANAQPAIPLKFISRIIYCSASKTPPDPFIIQGLQQQEEERRKRTNGRSGPQKENGVRSKAGKTHTFGIESIACGQWTYMHDRLTFLECYSDPRHGSIILGGKSLVIFLYKRGNYVQNVRMDIDYGIIDSITTGTLSGRSTVSFTLVQAPAFSTFEFDTELEHDPAQKPDDISHYLATLSLQSAHKPGVGRSARPQRSRVCSLAPGHEAVAGSTFVYQVIINDPKDIHIIQNTLNNTHGTPPWLPFPTSRIPRYDFLRDYNKLIADLTNMDSYGRMPFPVLFQLQRLAQNGYLSPKSVIDLLPRIQDLARDKQITKTGLADGLRSLSKVLPQPGPDTEAKAFSLVTMVEIIKKRALAFRWQSSEFAVANNLGNLAMVHKVLITPSGTYLEGPDLDIKNRVIRKFPGRSDYFMRVTFADEDGDAFHTPHYISGQDVYHSRFKSVLNGSINIAGRRFVVLGWSHSSLRTHQCWFAAPFIHKGELIDARRVIKDLGDFGAIRSPAKCAARIGQTFSDSTDTITISKASVARIPDIERNGRVFTDGVGQISYDLLRKVWQEFRKSKRAHATLVQIRYQGAKGILNLNPSLKGEVLRLRESMIKFPGSNDRTLEICGASYKRLPMYLNRQLIKILEDMGSRPSAFLDLQEQAIEKLKNITKYPLNAARFLESNMTGLAARVPRLIRSLHSIALNFRDDPFLRDVVEMAALVQVRDLKHRARIPIEKGVTLYGTVDETGFLEEREIYVPVRYQDGKRDVLVGDCMVTRSPALHPGDVQIVKAVNVPPGSPLAKLHNCVVFSNRGDRDMPSMLSGGDLDGDLYNVIFDKSIWPKYQYEPADYPRTQALDIGRPVEIKDMTDFFVKFMETDQLGYICNTHLVVADQKQEGALHPSCRKLAAMASTAVDFSKTGIPVDMTEMPKDYNRKIKPDFMASAPRMIMQGVLGIEDLALVDEDENDPVRALDPGGRRTVFYPSTKVLGHLYRNIDETQFLRDMQRHRGDSGDTPLIKKVWSYVNRETKLIQWAHHLTTARNIKDAYEEHLVDTMHQFAANARDPLTELEVFSGTILGKSGGIPNSRVRQYNMDMKAKADRDVQFIIEWILRDEPVDKAPDDDDYYEESYYPEDDDMPAFTAAYAPDEDDGYTGEDGFEDVALGGTNEALERSTACFYVAVHEFSKRKWQVGPLRSFQYVAAAVCLQEVERFKEVSGLRW